MAGDALHEVLRLVADGRISAAEAGPILAALDDTAPTGRPGTPPAPAAPGPPDPPPPPGPDTGRGGHPRALRIEVREGDRQVVNLRLPLALGRFAMDRVPGLSAEHSLRVREALANGVTGPILEVTDDDGSGVRIVVE